MKADWVMHGLVFNNCESLLAYWPPFWRSPCRQGDRPLLLHQPLLTRRLRSESMHALLRQHIGYFDAESNSAGQLVAFLGEKVMLVQALNGERLQIMVRSMCIVVVAIAFILIFGTWQVRMRSGLGDGERMLIGWVVAG